MDGIECTRRFRAWEQEQQCLLDAVGVPRRPRVLIIGMSANSDTQSKQEALDAGMDYFCPKPFNYQDFETIIRTYCGKYTTTNAIQPTTYVPHVPTF
jgi:CheY-like chemotaxis protein